MAYIILVASLLWLSVEPLTIEINHPVLLAILSLVRNGYLYVLRLLSGQS